MSELYEAVCEGDLKLVAWLIRNGVDVNLLKSERTGATLLMEAAWDGNLALVKLLIEKGRAWVNVADRYGTTALMVAAEQGHADIVKTLLEAGAEIDTKDSYGCTALMFATICNSSTTAEYLIDAGANLNIKNIEGHDVFYYAVRNGRERLAFSILDRLRGYTALKICSARGLDFEFGEVDD